MIVTTQLLVVFYTFFCDYPTFVLYFIHFFFFLLAVGSLSLSLCLGYWEGLHGSGPFLTAFVFVLFKYTILPCFGQKKKKRACL